MKAALIGHGMVAGAHLAALNDSSIVNICGILGRTPERAAAFAERHSVGIRVYSDVEELCADPSVDFAILTTPPNERLGLNTALFEAKIPVLMEKPIERTLKTASDIVGLGEAQGVTAGVVFQHRARDASLALKKLIDEGLLGDPVAAEIRVPWWRPQSYYDEPGRGTLARDGGGVLLSQAIHTLDLALWFLGPVVSLQAMLTTTPLHDMETEDWAGALLIFKNGTSASLTATTSFYPGSPESISIQGTKAHAHLESGMLSVSYLNGLNETFGNAAAGTGGGADPMAFTHTWHQRIIEDFARAVRDGRAPICTARFALQSHAVIDAMERSSRMGKTVEVKPI